MEGKTAKGSGGFAACRVSRCIRQLSQHLINGNRLHPLALRHGSNATRETNSFMIFSALANDSSSGIEATLPVKRPMTHHSATEPGRIVHGHFRKKTGAHALFLPVLRGD